MVEPAVVKNVAGKKKTIADELAFWKDKAPICSCGQDQVVYICKDPQCHQGKEERLLYCTICNEEGVHEHKKHVRITAVLSTLHSKWL